MSRWHLICGRSVCPGSYCCLCVHCFFLMFHVSLVVSYVALFLTPHNTHTHPPRTPHPLQLKELPAMVALVTDSNPERQQEGTSRFRKLLSIERHPPIAEVIRCGVVPIFTAFLQRAENPKLQFEAAWALTNIARCGCVSCCRCSSLLQLSKLMVLFFQWHFCSHPRRHRQQRHSHLRALAGFSE